MKKEHKIKSYRDLTREIDLLQQKKELVATKISNDIDGIKQQLLSVQNGFHLAQSIVKLFKASHENQVPPKEKVKNIAINTALDILTQLMEQRMTEKPEAEKEGATPPPKQED